MTGTAHIIRGNALDLPLADASVDLICTSPPYFGLRSYQDGGEHYPGQIGAEPTPAEFVDALIAATREMVRVLKPSGSIWVNLGDKYSQRTAMRRSSHQDGLFPDRPDLAKDWKASRAAGEARMPYENVTNPATGNYVPEKSLMGIPWRYAIRCIDDLGLILRAEIIWAKPNGLPESVTDRVRRSHETWFHFTKSPRYYSAVDEIREAYTLPQEKWGHSKGATVAYDISRSTGYEHNDTKTANPLGKLLGSVWSIPTQPLQVPPELGIDHFAAYPMEFPRRIIRGWSPAGVCVVCHEGRRPVIASVGLNMDRPQARRAQQLADQAGLTEQHFEALLSVGVSDTGRGKATQSGTGKNTAAVYALADEARTVLGGYSREYLLRRPTGLTYACACPDISAPTTPGVVLDPFSGTGTTALVAKALGRTGISVDMSQDYCRLAEWRTTDRGQLAAAMQVDKPDPVSADQLDLFGEAV